jgi:hypothetical protein
VISLIRCCNLVWISMKKNQFSHLVCAAHFSLLDFVRSGRDSLRKCSALVSCSTLVPVSESLGVRAYFPSVCRPSHAPVSASSLYCTAEIFCSRSRSLLAPLGARFSHRPVSFLGLGFKNTDGFSENHRNSVESAGSNF